MGNEWIYKLLFGGKSFQCPFPNLTATTFCPRHSSEWVFEKRRPRLISGSPTKANPKFVPPKRDRICAKLDSSSPSFLLCLGRRVGQLVILFFRRSRRFFLSEKTRDFQEKSCPEEGKQMNPEKTTEKQPHNQGNNKVTVSPKT